MSSPKKSQKSKARKANPGKAIKHGDRTLNTCFNLLYAKVSNLEDLSGKAAGRRDKAINTCFAKCLTKLASLDKHIKTVKKKLR
jgi:hypothetical protein